MGMPQLRYTVRRHSSSVIYKFITISLLFTFIFKYLGNSSVATSRPKDRREIRHSAFNKDSVDFGNFQLAPNEGLANEKLDGQLKPANLRTHMDVGTTRKAIPWEKGTALAGGGGGGERGGGFHPNASSGIANANLHVPVHYRTRIESEGSPDDSNQSFGEEAKGMTDRKNVLIVAAMRTGSSFLGELFKQRQDFFYMFEPGMQIMHKLDSLNLTRRVIYTKVIDMLDHFYDCDFDSVPFFVKEIEEMTIPTRKKAIPSLVSPMFCRPRRLGQRMKDACDTPTAEILERACSTRKHTAIKSIRVFDINLMLHAVTDQNVKLKLIHLVRDPRSMILSRLKLDFPTIKLFNVTDLSSTYIDILYRYCSNWLRNYEIGHYVPLMRKNYLMVRYEDLALEPYVYAKKIYEFARVGAEIPPNVTAWIDKNTNTFDKNTNTNDQIGATIAPFSTKRDSRSVLVSWKSRLTLEMARAIEGVRDCTDLMKVTGYKLIGDDYQLLSNTDHLVDKVPAPEFDINAFDFM